MKDLKAFLKRVNWTNTIFILGTLLFGVVGTVLLCLHGMVHWATWVFAGAYLLLTGTAVTAGYHRLFSHKAYKASWPVRFFF